MLKKVAYIIVALFFLGLSAKKVSAREIAGGSASFKAADSHSGTDFRVENLRNFLLKFNSPLAEYAQDFVTFADMYGIDYRLVPSISGVESTFGRHIPSPRSFNAYGWANGGYIFSSWQDSIQTVTSTLQTQYIEKGAPTIAKIARRYAPPSTTWGHHVQFFINKIDTLPLSFDLSS